MKILIILAALVLTAASMPIGTTVGDWKLSAKAKQDKNILLTAALPLRNADALHTVFQQVSDPTHPNYGNYMTPEEIEDLTGSELTRVNAVKNWFATIANASSISVIGLNSFVRGSVSVATVSQLLSVELSEFTHHTGVKIIRTLDTPQVPAEIAEHVDFFIGISHFPTMERAEAQQITLEAEGPEVTPDVVRTLYGVNEKFSGNSKSNMACAEFQSQSYSPSDLAHFQTVFSLPTQPVVNETGDHIDEHGVEANLDVQYIQVTGQLIPTDFYLQKGLSFDLIGWITAVEAEPYLTYVWSVSYGEDISQVTVAYAQRLDQEFQKVALRGVSILFASGDSGVYSRTGGYERFHPSFPASLPSVTSVGATQITKDKVEDSSTSWSGGGFSLSTYFTTPTYQQAAVSTYLSTGPDLPPAKYFDAKGRGFPDVSAVGVNYVIIERLVKAKVSGTSASCPTVAGVIALLNDVRLSAGKKSLGFLNPLLYQNPQVFNDITKGTNNDGHGQGFTATVGWDPLTGLGTPNYPKLKTLALMTP